MVDSNFRDQTHVACRKQELAHKVFNEISKRNISYVVHGLVLQSPSMCIYEAKNP